MTTTTTATYTASQNRVISTFLAKYRADRGWTVETAETEKAGQPVVEIRIHKPGAFPTAPTYVTRRGRLLGDRDLRA